MRPRAKSHLSIVRDEGDTSEATVLIYDIIDMWGVNASDFINSIRTLDVETIHVRINSPGGNVFDGLAIANALREHKAHVITHIDGIAASIASVIAVAGDEVLMADNAFFMIHDPWTITMGNSREIRKTADMLDKVATGIIKDYVKRGTDEKQVKQWMADETWFDATEAKDAGFIDTIIGQSEEDAPADRASVAELFDLQQFGFKHAPAALASRDVKKKPTTRDLEAALRDAGCTSAEAKRILASGLKSSAETRDANQAVISGAERLINLLSQ
jgi:ATP-dependent Clp protease protease subunit